MTHAPRHDPSPSDAAEREREDALREAGAGDGLLGSALTAARPAPALAPDALAAALSSLEQLRQRDARSLAGRVRAVSTPLRVALALGLSGVVVVAVALLRPRADLALYPVARMVLSVAALGALLVAAVRLATWPVHRPEPAPRRLWAWLALGGVLVPVVLALLPPPEVVHSASHAGLGAELVPRAAACFGFGMALAVPVLVVLRLADRGGHGSWWRAALAAVAAGLVGDLALQLHCPIVWPEHLLAGHASVILALTAAYGAAQTWWARRRRRA